jgi:hypothetical protein
MLFRIYPRMEPPPTRYRASITKSTLKNGEQRGVRNPPRTGGPAVLRGPYPCLFTENQPQRFGSDRTPPKAEKNGGPGRTALSNNPPSVRRRGGLTRG